MNENVDVVVGIRTFWAANATLEAACPVARVYFEKLPGTPVYPYVRLEVSQWREPEFPLNSATSGWPYKDYRQIVLKMFGVNPATDGDIYPLADAIFNQLKLGRDDVPNSRVLDWLTAGDNGDPIHKAKSVTTGSDPVYEGSRKYTLELQRIIP